MKIEVGTELGLVKIFGGEGGISAFAADPENCYRVKRAALDRADAAVARAEAAVARAEAALWAAECVLKASHIP